MPHSMSSLPRLEYFLHSPAASPSLIFNGIATRFFFPKGCRLERIMAQQSVRSVTGDEDLQHGITQDNQPVAVWRVPESPLGGVVCAALFVGITANCSGWQVPHVLEGWGCRARGASMTCRAVGSSRLLGDGSCWDPAGVWCPPPGSSLLRAVITADCMSQRPALIGLSLSVRGQGGAGLCGAAMATGPFNENEHAVTNDIPEPIGYTANGQFAASLTHLHNNTQTRRHTCHGVVKPHWIEDSFHHESIHDKWTSVLTRRLIIHSHTVFSVNSCI